MSYIEHSIITDGHGGEHLTVYLPGHGLKLASSSQPHYADVKATIELADAHERWRTTDIGPDRAAPYAAYRAAWDATPEGNRAAAVRRDFDALAAMFDPAKVIEERFRKLSDKVSVSGGVLLYDGDPQDDTVSQEVLAFMEAGEDFGPLLAFMERIRANPSDHSRGQLFDWLRARIAAGELSLSPEGHILAYKGCGRGEDGVPVSGFTGHALVFPDGQTEAVEYQDAHIPYAVGSTVEMPRSEVAFDPGNACSRGLHVGTFKYASGYQSGGGMLQVAVDPADVVSVPTDANGEKVRVCRLRVVRTVTEPTSAPMVPADFVGEDWSDGDECEPY